MQKFLKSWVLTQFWKCWWKMKQSYEGGGLDDIVRREGGVFAFILLWVVWGPYDAHSMFG